MGHHHDDEHHHHHHDHHNHHDPDENKQALTFPEKARKLIAHWIRHNEDHAHSYRQWADEFRRNDLSAAAAMLESAAELTSQINHTLVQAEDTISPADD